MKGEFVVVRAYGEEPKVLRIWEVRGDTALVSAPDQFAKLESGAEALLPVGFPMQDVFQYDPKLEGEIASGKIEWQHLTPYTQKNKAREKA